jgi:hypothetical protein
MALDPISLGIAAVSTGMGILQGNAQNAAAQQQYKDQVRYSKAVEAYNKWQSKFNKKQSDATSRFQYWQQVVNYNQEKAYTNQLRNYDLAQEFAQAKKVFQTRVGAQTDYMVSAQALSDRFQEEGMQQAVAMQTYQMRSLQTSAAYRASEQTGQSVDRIVNDVDRQFGDYQTLMSINERIKTRQYNREQLSQVTEYISRYNSQDFYKAAPRNEPIPPFAPIPSIVMPPPPSMTGAAPQFNQGLNIGTAALGGINTYFSMADSIKKLGA